ncbi:MAG: hypothetical protein E7319_00795 [Clostridiales bacterium]|nr:hypothetical protein [Clostridiales bacterium]
MKKWLSLLLCFCLTIIPLAQVEARGETFTVMIYLCGTDLESQGGMATSDLTEMVRSGIPKNGDVNIYIQTGGTSRWQTNGLSNRKAERWSLSENGIKKLETLGSVNMGAANSLQDFIEYGFENFPADRYGLIFWDHGSGATGGLCHDEITGDCLYYPEIYSALEGATRGMRGTPFAFIGFDACLMGSYEMALHLMPFAEYMIASEELEPGTGWNYTGWLPTLVADPGVSMEKLGKVIVDSFVTTTAQYGRSEYATLSVIDLSEMDPLIRAVEEMAVSLDGALDSDLSSISRLRQNMRSFGQISNAASDMVDMTTYAEVFARYDQDAASEIKTALKDVVVYSRYTNNLSGVTGLSILMPFSTRYQSSTYMKYYDTENLTPKHTAFVKNFLNELGSGSSSGQGYGFGSDLFGFGLPSISSQSVQSAEIDWFSQYSSDQDSYSQNAGDLWGSLYGSGYQESNASDFSLGSFLGMLFGDSSSGFDSSYDSYSSSLWGDPSAYSDSSFASDSGYGSSFTDIWGTSDSAYDDSWSSFWGTPSTGSTGGTGDLWSSFWGTPSTGSTGSTDDPWSSFWGTPSTGSTGSTSGSTGDSWADFWGVSSSTATPAPTNTPVPVQETDDSHVTIQTADGEVTLENPFAGTDSEYAYTLELTEEQLDVLGKVEANLMMDISDPDFECYVELGYVQDVVVDWNRGKIYGLFDGTWATLGGQMVCMYDQVANERYVRSLIPVTLNGEECYVLVIFDEENPQGQVVGTTEGYTEDGLPSRGITELKPGDKVIPQYELLYWDADGNQQSEPFEGDPIIVGRDGTIPFGYEEVEGDVDYCYGFCLTDIYGDEIFTDFITLSY